MIAASAVPAAQAGGAAGGGTGFSATDVLQYWKFSHLVPAQGLRVAYDTLLDGR